MRIPFIMLLFLPLHLFAQETSEPTTQEKYVRPKFYELGLGFNISRFRDFATSPLNYVGGAGEFVVGTLRRDESQEVNFSFRLSSGTYVSAGNSLESTVAIANAAFINYSRLYQIKSLSSDKWNFKVGGKIDLTGNIRQNPSLLNNSTGIEAFQTFFASAKVTKDISRTTLKVKKFLFIRYKRYPQRRELSFQLNPSLINSTYRNGYAYISQASVIGSEDPFSDYKFSVFSGFRINTALDYTRYLTNGNGIKLSYLWDAYKTGGSLPRFEMSHHMFQVALLFKVK